MTTIRTRGIVTNCITGQQRIIDLKYQIKFRDDGREEIDLIDGVTGYESFIVDKDLKNLEEMTERGWMANVDTNNMYDTLYIPAEEMRLILSLVKRVRKNKEEYGNNEAFGMLEKVREYINGLFSELEEIGEFDKKKARLMLKQIDEVIEKN